MGEDIVKTTIHQPDFMPWYGLFSKISKSDCWIVLDHTHNNPKDASFWGRRVQILVNGKAHWLSIPLKKSNLKESFTQPINQMVINTSDKKLFKKLQQTIKMSYIKTPYFKKYYYLVERYFNHSSDNLQRRNMEFIIEVMRILKISTKIIYSSDFNFTTKKTELLIDLLKATNSTTYLCGNGASGYQDDALFAKHNISLEYNVVNHPIYKQPFTSSCVQGLSILDLLFNMGEEKIIEHLQGEQR